MAVLSPTSTAHDWASVDPDTLFETLTVAEIRRVHSKLLQSADAKQEELRLMVGERYRDLLQASTSIISMDASSKRILSTLNQVKSSSDIDIPRTVQDRRPTPAQDLSEFQILAAHVKLLLDAPEHLWRLLERKQFLHAAWLYLLCRLTYRALSSGNVQQSEAVLKHEIDVMEDFPLIQKLWETISHMRSQILHRATQQLKASFSEPRQSASCLLTLHLLDNTSFRDIFGLYLSSATKMIHVVIQRHAAGNHSPTSSDSKQPSAFAANAVEHGRTVIEQLREAIWNVLYTGRILFGDISNSGILKFSLHEIDSGAKGEESIIPVTEKILSGLASSPHLSMLPSSLRSYRPTLDVASVAVSLDISEVSSRLNAWAKNALASSLPIIIAQFANISRARDITILRSTLCYNANHEIRVQFPEIVLSWDNMVSLEAEKQIMLLWATTLKSMESIFTSSLDEAMSNMKAGAIPTVYDFSPPGLINVLGVGTGDVDTTALRTILQRRLQLRNPPIDDIIANLEDIANKLREDFKLVDGISSMRLMSAYREGVKSSLNGMIITLTDRIKNSAQPSIESNHDIDPKELLVDHVARLLLHQSKFLTSIHCSKDDAEASRREFVEINNLAIQKWKQCLASITSRRLIAVFDSSLHMTLSTEVRCPPLPSNSCLDCCKHLAESVRKIGLVGASLESANLAQMIFLEAVASALPSISFVIPVWNQDAAQLLFDLIFLEEIGSGCDLVLESPDRQDSLSHFASAVQRLKQQVPDLSRDTVDDMEADLRTKMKWQVQNVARLLTPLVAMKVRENAKGETKEILSTGAHVLGDILQVAPPSGRIGLVHITTTGD